MASNKTSGAAARRYANALVETAEDSKKLDAVLKDLGDLDAMLSQSEDLQRIISSPLITRQEQQNTMAALSDKAKFNDITKNFLMLLAQNRRLNTVSAAIQSVHAIAADKRGEVHADVQSAVKLTAAQEKALAASLSKSTGKTVNVHVEVDPALIGGMVVTVGSKMIDDSVKRKLERLERTLSGGSNQNVNHEDTKARRS